MSDNYEWPPKAELSDDFSTAVKEFTQTFVNATWKFAEAFGRAPNARELDLLYAAVQRYYGVEETMLKQIKREKEKANGKR